MGIRDFIRVPRPAARTIPTISPASMASRKTTIRLAARKLPCVGMPGATARNTARRSDPTMTAIGATYPNATEDKALVRVHVTTWPVLPQV